MCLSERERSNLASLGYSSSPDREASAAQTPAGYQGHARTGFDAFQSAARCVSGVRRNRPSLLSTNYHCFRTLDISLPDCCFTRSSSNRAEDSRSG